MTVLISERTYVLPDFPFLFFDDTIIRNVAMIVHLYKAEASGIEERIIELLREFDLLPLAQTPVRALSRGQGYKTGLVALLAVNPKIWILDEPFASGMDPHGINAFKRHARNAVQQGRTVIYSTQLLDVAERFSDRVCVIHQGELRAFDTLDKLREHSMDKDNVLEELFRQLREEKS